ARFCRARVPTRAERRGHSAAASTTTAAARRAMKSQPTPGIVDTGLNPAPCRADTSGMVPMLAAAYVLFWMALIRALLVRAGSLAPMCARCGLKYEREVLGERVCRCDR